MVIISRDVNWGSTTDSNVLCQRQVAIFGCFVFPVFRFWFGLQFCFWVLVVFSTRVDVSGVIRKSGVTFTGIWVGCWFQPVLVVDFSASGTSGVTFKRELLRCWSAGRVLVGDRTWQCRLIENHFKRFKTVEKLCTKWNKSKDKSFRWSRNEASSNSNQDVGHAKLPLVSVGDDQISSSVRTFQFSLYHPLHSNIPIIGRN